MSCWVFPSIYQKITRHLLPSISCHLPCCLTRKASSLIVSAHSTLNSSLSRIAHLVDSSGRVRRAYVVEAPGYFAEMVLDDLEAMGDCDPNE